MRLDSNKIITVVAILVVLIGGWSCFILLKQDKEKTTLSTNPAYEVSIDQLAFEYSKDKAATLEKYQGKVITIAGKAVNIKGIHVDQEVTLILSNRYETFTIETIFSPKHRNNVFKTRDSYLKVKGIVGKTSDDKLKLDGAIIVKVFKYPSDVVPKYSNVLQVTGNRQLADWLEDNETEFLELEKNIWRVTQYSNAYDYLLELGNPNLKQLDYAIKNLNYLRKEFSVKSSEPQINEITNLINRVVDEQSKSATLLRSSIISKKSIAEYHKMKSQITSNYVGPLRKKLQECGIDTIGIFNEAYKSVEAEKI